MAVLDEDTFRKKAVAELNHLAKVLDSLAGLTVDFAGDNLTIEFDDGEKYVANPQGPARQLWFAARYQAGHYDLHGDGSWKDMKTGEPLRSRVARDVSAKLGVPVTF